jgi:hypothetical protein
MKITKRKTLNVRIDDGDQRAIREGVAAFRKLQSDPVTATIRNASDFVRLACGRLSIEAVNALAKETQ